MQGTRTGNINEIITIEHILNEIAQYNTPYVCVTGGEPLAQSNCLKLLDYLVNSGYKASLETSGSIDIGLVNDQVSVVMDIKTPSSTEEKQNRYENLSLLKSKDQLKFVIASRSDFDWCTDLLNKHKINSEILFSPVYESLKPVDLADWILEKKLHKLLWGEQKGK